MGLRWEGIGTGAQPVFFKAQKYAAGNENQPSHLMARLAFISPLAKRLKMAKRA